MARQFRTPRLPKTWNFIAEFTLQFTGGATTAVSGVSVGEPGTVLRTLTEYVIQPLQGGTFAAGDECFISVGLGIFSADAFSAGGGSLTDPGSEPDFDWLYWKQHPLLLQATSVQALLAPAATVRATLDGGAMRKLKTNRTLGWVVEYTDATGTPPYTVVFGKTRVLFAGI